MFYNYNSITKSSNLSMLFNIPCDLNKKKGINKKMKQNIVKINQTNKFTKYILGSTVLLLCIFLSFLKTPYAASQGCLSVDYIDVVNSNAESGDASLISYNNKYVLIDGGKSSAYIDKLKKFLVSVCNPTNGKIVLEAVIVSHNHSDHYGGIVKLLKDTNTFKVKKVIKSNVAPVTALNNACENAESVKNITINSGKYQMKFGNASITVYPPTKKFSTGNASADVNNSSMIVIARGPNGNADKHLFLGDLYYSGIQIAKSKYPEIFANVSSSPYRSCKFAHHGHRGGGGGNLSSEVVSEVEWYKKNVNASAYYLSTSRRFVHMNVKKDTLTGNDLSVRKNFEYIKKNICKDRNSTMASYEGNMGVFGNIVGLVHIS